MRCPICNCRTSHQLAVVDAPITCGHRLFATCLRDCQAHPLQRLRRVELHRPPRGAERRRIIVRDMRKPSAVSAGGIVRRRAT